MISCFVFVIKNRDKIKKNCKLTPTNLTWIEELFVISHDSKDF